MEPTIRIKGGANLEAIIKSAENEMQAAAIIASKKAAHEVGLRLKADLKARSLAYGWTNYAKGWSMRTNEYGVTIYNRKQPGLTFLLEFGHDIIRGGKKIGETKPHPHIKLAEEQAIIDFEETIIREMEAVLGT